MRAIRIALLAIPLSGCGQGFHDQMTCRHVAGPEPGAELMLLGLVGALAMASMDSHKIWQHDVDTCVRDVGNVRMTLRN
jgi:hypothetical protein